MKKYIISYYYLATGMEGKPQTYPEMKIEAPNKIEAAFFYQNHFNKSITREVFDDYREVHKFWGLDITEIKEDE